MKKHFNYGKRHPALLALFLGVSVSMAAVPQAIASWDADDGKKKAAHHGSDGGDKWSGKKAGGSFDMGGEGFMTARLRAVWSLDLSKDQKTKIRAIQRDLRSAHWALEDKVELAADKIFDLYKSDSRDAKSIGKVYGEIFDYRRQKIELAIEAGNKVEAQLTQRQLASLKKWRPKHKWGGGWKGSSH